MKKQVLSYVAGFFGSLIITLIAYFFVTETTIQGLTIALLIGMLAVVQLAIQLLFFLHIGNEDKPRWNLYALGFMVLVVIIIVAGSIWIMANLNYNGHTMEKIDSYIMEEENIHREEHSH